MWQPIQVRRRRRRQGCGGRRHLLEVGADLPAIQQLLGHASPATLRDDPRGDRAPKGGGGAPTPRPLVAENGHYPQTGRGVVVITVAHELMRTNSPPIGGPSSDTPNYGPTGQRGAEPLGPPGSGRVDGRAHRAAQVAKGERMECDTSVVSSPSPRS